MCSAVAKVQFPVTARKEACKTLKGVLAISSNMSVVGVETVVISFNTELLRLMRKYNNPLPRAPITGKNNKSRRQSHKCCICA